MIIFDRKKYVKGFLQNGIKENGYTAQKDLFMVAMFLQNQTTYSKSAIIKKLKDITKDYFKGLPNEMIDKNIQAVYQKARLASKIEEERTGYNGDTDFEEAICYESADGYFDIKKLNLYVSELQAIKKLDASIQEYAFVFLVMNKFMGRYFDEKTSQYKYYEWTYECNADIFRILGKKESGATRNKKLYNLSQNDIVNFNCFVNYKYKFNRQNKIANVMFRVPINVDAWEEEKKSKEKVWMQITNYDDIMLYWRLYIGDQQVTTCDECGCPILNTNNSKKYCDECATERTKESKKRSKIKLEKVAV